MGSGDKVGAGEGLAVGTGAGVEAVAGVDLVATGDGVGAEVTGGRGVVVGVEATGVPPGLACGAEQPVEVTARKPVMSNPMTVKTRTRRDMFKTVRFLTDSTLLETGKRTATF